MLYFLRFTSDYPENGRYSFDPITKNYSLSVHKTYKEASEGVSGIANECYIGFWKRRLVFAAYYVVDERLVVVHIDGQTFEWPGNFKVRYRTLFPFLRCFEVLKAGQVLLSYKYFFVDGGFYGPNDFFQNIAETVKDLTSIARTIYIYREIAAGHTIGDDNEANDFIRYYIKKYSRKADN